MPSIVSQTTSTPIVQTVTVTLDADEVFQIVNALSGHGYSYLSAQMRALLDVQPTPQKVTPDIYLSSGVQDSNIRGTRKIQAVKSVRDATGSNLRDALDAVRRRAVFIGVTL